MIIDPNCTICTYKDNPKQIIDYIADSLGFNVFVFGPGNYISMFLSDNNENSLIELFYCEGCFYLWPAGAPRLMENQYCVDYTPVSNIINRFLHVYHNYRQHQKINHQQDIRQAGVAYDV